MSKRALVIVSDGFEDIEAVAPIDVLTRVGVLVTVASLKSGPVHAAYGTKLVPDCTLDQIDSLYDAIVIPGGKKNAQTLASDARVRSCVRAHHEAVRIVAAICASPSHVLGEACGILVGKRACGDPGFNEKLEKAGALLTDQLVTQDGNIITSVGPGSALIFALKIAAQLAGEEEAQKFAGKWGVGF